MHLSVRQSRDKGPNQCRLELKEASRCLLRQFPLKFGTLFFLLLSPKTRVLPVRAIIQINSALGRRGLLDCWSGWQAAEPNVATAIHSSQPGRGRRSLMDGDTSHLTGRLPPHCTQSAAASLNVSQTDDGMTKLFIFRAQSSRFFHFWQMSKWNVQSEMWKHFHFHLKCLAPENKPAWVCSSALFWSLFF